MRPRPLRFLGRLRARWWAEDATRPAWQTLSWALVLAALLVGLALRLGATDWYTDYPLTDSGGGAYREGTRLPKSFASIDHPFHIAKERATVDALREGRLPRWFSNHQGGFPAEFYPLGGDLIVAAVYLLGLGLIPLAVAHKLVTIGVLLLPPLAYWAIARRDRLPLSVAVLAAVLHLFVRGSWLAGGSRELIDYGLWPDVLASYLPLFIILWGADWLRAGDRRGLLLATGAATLAIYTNPRSILGIAAACTAVGLVAVSEAVRLRPLFRRRPAPPARRLVWGEQPRVYREAPPKLGGLGGLRAGGGWGERLWRRPPVGQAGRGALLAVLVGLLSAALLLPLRAHQDLYQFTIYVRFESAEDVWRWYNESVLSQLIRLAGLGIVVGLLRRGFYGRVFAILLPLSGLMVTLVGWTLGQHPIFAQLEGPRLMPLLRPATIFLAALGAHETIRAGLRLVRLRGATMLAGGATILLAAGLLLSSRSPLDRELRGLPLEETTDQPVFTALARSAGIVAALSTPADKPLIIGNPISWHASFWIPALTGRDVYHNDWLWFWRTVDYGSQELLVDEWGALERDFLARHGLTMLLIDAGRGDLLELAATKPYLRGLDPGAPGGYAVYRVEGGAPNGWITFVDGGEVTALDVGSEGLRARGRSERAGVARIIINDFPRWRARVNGEPVPIARSDDGYMLVPVPAGEVTIALDYRTEPIGWLARGLVLLGLLLLAVLVRPVRPARPRDGKPSGGGRHN